MVERPQRPRRRLRVSLVWRVWLAAAALVAGIAVLLLIGSIGLYVTQIVSIEVTSLLLIVALALFGILEPAEALSGFSSPATITVVSERSCPSVASLIRTRYRDGSARRCVIRRRSINSSRARTSS